MLPAVFRLYLNPPLSNQQNHKLLSKEDFFTYERAHISLGSSEQSWSSPTAGDAKRGLILVSGLGGGFGSHRSVLAGVWLAEVGPVAATGHWLGAEAKEWL